MSDTPASPTSAKNNRRLTLPTDSYERKSHPLLSGVLRYFPAALSGVAKTSKLGNDKHNPGEEMHHARGKSTDHGDCIIRHLVDVQDLLAAMQRKEAVSSEEILNEVNQMAWRALALSQEIHESLGAPMAPAAKNPDTIKIETTQEDTYLLNGVRVDKQTCLRSVGRK